MKVKTQHQSAQLSTAPLKTIEFKFVRQNQGLIAKTLWSGLYQKPLEAVLRETLANAHDAHVEAGKEKTPIEVQLPTVLDCSFSVRDYGVGIDEARLKTLAQWGSSTKRKDQKQTGGFGYGVKAIWSYADLFLLTTWVDGFEYVYCFEPGPKGVGQAILLEEPQPSNEPTGTRIQVAIQPQDLNGVLDLYQDLTRGWKTRPTTNVEPEYPNAVFQGDNWVVWSTKSYWNLDELPKVQMGTVEYKITPLKSRIKSPFVEMKGLVLTVPIGSLDLESSREGIQDTEHNGKVIQKALDSCQKDLEQQLKRSFKGAKTLLEAQELLKQYLVYFKQKNDHNGRAVDAVIGKLQYQTLSVKWRNIPISPQYFMKGVTKVYEYQGDCVYAKHVSSEYKVKQPLVVSTVAPGDLCQSLINKNRIPPSAKWVKVKSTEQFLLDNPFLKVSTTVVLRPQDVQDCWQKNPNHIKVYKLRPAGYGKERLNKHLVKETINPKSSKQYIYCEVDEILSALWTSRAGSLWFQIDQIREVLELLETELYCVNKSQLGKFLTLKGAVHIRDYCREWINKNSAVPSIDRLAELRYAGFKTYFEERAATKIDEVLDTIEAKLETLDCPELRTIQQLLKTQKQYISAKLSIQMVAYWLSTGLCLGVNKEAIDAAKSRFKLGFQVLQLEPHQPLYQHAYDYFDQL